MLLQPIGIAIAIALQELTKSIMVCLLVSLPSLACLDGVAQRLPDRSFLNGGGGGNKDNAMALLISCLGVILTLRPQYLPVLRPYLVRIW